MSGIIRALWLSLSNDATDQMVIFIGKLSLGITMHISPLPQQHFSLDYIQLYLVPRDFNTVISWWLFVPIS